MKQFLLVVSFSLCASGYASARDFMKLQKVASGYGRTYTQTLAVESAGEGYYNVVHTVTIEQFGSAARSQSTVMAENVMCTASRFGGMATCKNDDFEMMIECKGYTCSASHYLTSLEGQREYVTMIEGATAVQ